MDQRNHAQGLSLQRPPDSRRPLPQPPGAGPRARTGSATSWRRRTFKTGEMTRLPAAAGAAPSLSALLRRLRRAGVRAGARRAHDRLHLRRRRSRRPAAPTSSPPRTTRFSSAACSTWTAAATATATIRTFTRAQMRTPGVPPLGHQGTYYGFTSYSNVTATIGAFDCDEHQLREGFLIHRMFDTPLLPDGHGGAVLSRHAARFRRADRAGFQAAVSGPGGRPLRAREHPTRQRSARRLPALLQLLVLRRTGQQGRGDRALRHAVPRVPHRRR